MSSRLLWGCAAGLVALASLAAGIAAWAWLALHAPYAGWSEASIDVALEPGMPAGAVVERLAERGVLRRPSLVRRWIALSGGAAYLQAGEYRFAEPASALDVLARLRAGDVLLHEVTLAEGLDRHEIADRLAAAGFGSSEELRRAFADPTPIRALDPHAADLEGYLFPDTYRFPRGTPAEGIARAMVERFLEVTGPDYAARAATVDLDVPGAVKLASMIEKETSLPGERGRISRVFHNRLRRGMRLECDPTVRYALERAGRPVTRLLYEHLRFESPWNTYRVDGLPVGPIGNPGRASLTAAVEPDEGNEIYFVAAPGGGHRFSSSLSEHLAAVATWRHYVRSSR